jgi:two-component system nitrate/nitrite response regulator NarL
MSTVSNDGRKTVRVAILDDHQSVVDGYLYRLEKTPHIEIAGVAEYGSELESLLASTPVDVFLLDIQVPTAPDNPNPYPILHVISELNRQQPELAILVISMMMERSLIWNVIDAGASGYILKNDRAAIQDLGAIIHSIARGGIFLSEKVREQWLKRLKRAESGVGLTARQVEILSLCAANPNWSRIQVAVHLDVTPSTVRNILHQAYLRLGVNWPNRPGPG